jgi:hypothetical protein
MTRILNARERKALDKLSFEHKDFLISGQLVGIGPTTLASLVALGLAETGPSARYYGETGWRILPDGWRCMYGRTLAEIMAPGAPKAYPLKVWSWPPSDR